jgi:hypothetical protein
MTTTDLIDILSKKNKELNEKLDKLTELVRELKIEILLIKNK